jgi:hypothetical protein
MESKIFELTLKFGAYGRPKRLLFVEVCLTMIKAESSMLPTIASSFSAFSERSIAEVEKTKNLNRNDNTHT